jgi:hypothetical protein
MMSYWELHPRLRAVVLAAVLALLGGFAAGCGSDDGAPERAAADSTTDRDESTTTLERSTSSTPRASSTTGSTTTTVPARVTISGVEPSSCLVFGVTSSAEASWVLQLSDGRTVSRYSFIDASKVISEDPEFGSYPTPLRISFDGGTCSFS